MPVYCYRTPDGQVHERVYPMGQAPRSVRIDGRLADRDIVAEHSGHKPTPGNWPFWSDAAGCNPDYADQWRAQLRANGVDAEIHPQTGCLKMESPAHRRAVCRALGLFDRNAGYSDPAPVNR